MRVALTFDAEHPDRPRCPPGAARSILETLAGAGVHATFFVQGRWAQAYPATARRIAADGHLVGSHSFYHARLPLLSDAGLEADIGDAEAAIRANVGVDPRPWFRCPFGAGWDDPRILAALERHGYRHVGWDVVPADWLPERTAAEVRRFVVEGALRQGDGSVVLLHTWPGPPAEALPGILLDLRAAGADLSPVDALPTLPGTAISP